MGPNVEKRVADLLIDGDLLLQLTESDLVQDIGLTDGIVSKR